MLIGSILHNILSNMQFFKLGISALTFTHFDSICFGQQKTEPSSHTVENCNFSVKLMAE